MTLRKRVLISLIVSIAAAVLLLAVSRAANSNVLFLPQLPGYFASLSIWGVHSGEWNSVAGAIVVSAANALVYWLVVFGLSFLLRNRGPK